jgi:hypothetical protein
MVQCSLCLLHFSDSVYIVKIIDEIRKAFTTFFQRELFLMKHKDF